MIDDSHDKSVCNESGNAVFLESWSRHQPGNNYLVDILAPKLSCLNMCCTLDHFWKYVDENRIARPSLATDDPLLLHMIHGMALSAKNVGVHYNVIRVLELHHT